ncbi:MAG: RNA polymerase sigma-70 factor [Microscillaceae bacterium]|nr:RNA polymerase sigma-70 factor [Microscillaceae bacterium]
MQLNDTEILSAIVAGNESVFEHFFRKYYQVLCNYGNSILKDIDEAEEVVQSVFMDIWEKKNDLQITTSLKSYLYRMVHNRCLNKLKHEKIKEEYKTYNYTQTQANPSNAIHLTLQNELEKQIEEAISDLPEQCRLIFKMSRFEELKYSEIAEQLSISVKTVENQMSKALKILREKLADYLVIGLAILLLNF